MKICTYCPYSCAKLLILEDGNLVEKKNVFSLLLQVIEASQRNKHTGVKGSRDGSMEGKRQKNIVVSKLKP